MRHRIIVNLDHSRTLTSGPIRLYDMGGVFDSRGWYPISKCGVRFSIAGLQDLYTRQDWYNYQVQVQSSKYVYCAFVMVE